MICAQQYRIQVGNFNNRNVNFNMQKYNGLNNDVSMKKQNFNFNNIFYIFIIYLAIYNTASYDQSIKSSNNKNAHVTNGNKTINNKSLNFLHFNKGPSYFHNKINDIHEIIDKYKPNIFSISEANYVIDRDNTDCGLFDSYNIETTDQLCKFNISRQLLLIDARLQYTRRYDLESKFECCIWVELKSKAQKIF